MSYIESRVETDVDLLGRRTSHQVHILLCDSCQQIFETRVSKAKLKGQKSHSCSMVCKKNSQRSGGSIARSRSETYRQKYGSDNVFASEYGKAKIKKTLLERYGAEHALQVKEFLEKAQKTCLENYGVSCAPKSAEIRERMVKTHRDRFGVDYPMQRKEVREKLREGCRKKYGVDYTVQNKEFRDRILEKG